MKASPSQSAAVRSHAAGSAHALKHRRKGLACGFIVAGLLGLAGPCLGQGKVVVGGAGSMVPMMQELARAYEAKKGPQGIEFMTNSLGSGGGIKGVEAGRLAMGLTGRPLKDNEKATVVYRQLAVMPVVIAASRSLPVSGLTAAQLCGIYSGAIKSWKLVGGPDVPIVPLTRNEDDSDKEALRDHVGCYKSLKESSDVVVLSSGGGMASALGARPAAIGLTSYEAVLKSQGRLKALALDGVEPNADSVAAGKYRLVKDFAVVTRGEPQGAVKEFLEFAKGDEGNKILAGGGLVPRK